MTRSQMIAGLTVVLSAIGLASLATAQSGTRSSPRPRSSRPGTGTQPTQGSTASAEVPFEDRLWKYLQQAQYRNWAPLPGVTGDAYDGNSPHGDKVKLYANRTAAAAEGKLPAGTILIKENFDSTGSKLMAVTVMYRAEHFNPDAGDWHWTKYEADGTVSAMKGMRVTGKVGMCIDCHRSAGGDDFVFVRVSHFWVLVERRVDSGVERVVARHWTEFCCMGA